MNIELLYLSVWRPFYNWISAMGFANKIIHRPAEAPPEKEIHWPD